MGAWEELDTLIKVEVDMEDLDSKINLPYDDPYGGFSDFVDAMKLRKAITIKSSYNAAKNLAEKNRSWQQQLIRDICDNPSGMLMSSIQEQQKGQFEWLVGTIINHIYPMALEYGRRGFSAKDAEALAFYYNGELIFRKSVGPAKPRPFVAPAYKKTDNIAHKFVENEVLNALNSLG